MRILIADDLQSKIAKLVHVLVHTCGVTRDQIEITQTAADTRRLLKDQFFDLFVMDILLPEKPEDPPSRTTSLDLLKEIIEEGMCVKPAHILGLTAYPEEAAAAEPYFRDQLWSLIKFDETNDGWAKPICNCIEYIKKQRAQTEDLSYDVDVCVITALQDPEMEAVVRLPWIWEAAEPLDNTQFVRRGRIVVDGQSYSIVAAVAPRMGMISAALLASKMIAQYRPRLLAMTGICAGIKEKTALGDIIFADTSWDWQSGKRIKDKENVQFSMDPHHLPVEEFLRARAQQLRSDRSMWNEIRLAWPSAPSQELRFLIGPIASGSAVLADGQIVSEIRTQQRTVLGVEMEAYGLFAAAASTEQPKPMVVVMKSVCDFADPDKHDAMQAYAAYTSAAAFRIFVERNLAEIVKETSR